MGGGGGLAKGVRTIGSLGLRFVKAHLSEYVLFGGMCQLLAFVPFINVLTLFTNYVGAALWVADMERRGQGAVPPSPCTPPPPPACPSCGPAVC